MALGALLNSLGAVSTSLSGIGGAMSSLGGIASGIGTLLSNAFSMAMTAAQKAFMKMKEIFNDHVKPLFERLWEIIQPIYEAIKTGFITIVNTMASIWNGVIMPIFSFFKDYISMLRS